LFSLLLRIHIDASSLLASWLTSSQQLCMNNMIALAPSLGCDASDAACLCKNNNFQWGIRDCSNAVCGDAVASTVISFGAGYCHGKSPHEVFMGTLLTWTNRRHCWFWRFGH
jgi:hypothetical protein